MNTAVCPSVVTPRNQWNLPPPEDRDDALPLPPAAAPVAGKTFWILSLRDWQLLESLCYDKSRCLRDRLLGPAARGCIAVGLRPAGISFLGVALMVAFVPLARADPRMAALVLLLSFLMDGLDGVVARQQAIQSDRGKFTDVVCGTLSVVLFGTGAVYAGLLEGALGVLLVSLLILSKVLRTVHRGFCLSSDWLFRPVAGLTPNLIGAVAGGLFCLKACGVITVSLNPWFAAALPVLLLDAALAYARILKLRP